MTTESFRITGVAITPVAFADPPLLNSVGVHEPFALRAIIEIRTDAGLTGLGETYADEKHLTALQAAATSIEGVDVYHTEEIRRRVEALAAPETAIASGLIGQSAPADRVFSAFEVACLDIQGKVAGRPVADLLGGAVRTEVPFSAYLFYKWAAHPGLPAADDWGPALDPGGIVAQAKRMVEGYGFTALKLKGGVFPPAQEIEAVRALRDAFPDHPLRLDPNAAWTPETSLNVARELAGVLEYLEDPTPGIDGMARVARDAPMPLATNMCVVAFSQLPPAVPPTRAAANLADRLARQAPRPFGEEILIRRTGMIFRPAPAACDRDLGRFPLLRRLEQQVRFAVTGIFPGTRHCVQAMPFHCGPQSGRCRRMSRIVDPEHVASKAVATVGEQVRDDAGDPVGCARHVDLERDRVDGDVALTELECERSGEHVRGGFGRCVEAVGRQG